MQTQQELWASKRQKLQQYRQNRETPLGYIPKITPPDAPSSRLTQKMPITFLSEHDLRVVSNQFARYVFENRKKMSKSTRQRYRQYMSIGRDVTKTRASSSKRARPTASTKHASPSRSRESTWHEDGYEVASHWTDNESFSIESRKTSMASSRPASSRPTSSRTQSVRMHSAAAENRSTRNISEWIAEEDVLSTGRSSRPQTAGSAGRGTKRKKRAASTGRKMRPQSSHAWGGGASSASQISSHQSTRLLRPVTALSAHNREVRNDLIADSLIDNLETSHDASLSNLYRELPAFARRKIYDEQVREEHMRQYATVSLKRAALAHQHTVFDAARGGELTEDTARQGLEEALKQTIRKDSSTSLVITSVRMHDPNSHEEDDELYYGTKELSEKIRNGKWKDHLPPPLPTYDTKTPLDPTLDTTGATSPSKNQRRHQKDSSAFKQQYHDYFKNDPYLNAPVDMRYFGAESFVDLSLLGTEMSFTDLKTMLIDLYCEMRVPFSQGDELIDLYFDKDLPLSRKMILVEINKLILTRAELLRILEEVQKFKSQEYQLEQNRGRVKPSELQRRETQLQELAKTILSMIYKWQEQSYQLYPWKQFVYRGEDLLSKLSKM